MKQAPARNEFHLPDFCAGNTTLVVVLIVELVALVITAARAPFNNSFWIDLATTSLFLLWQGLIAAVVLCKLRPRLMTLPAARAYGITLLSVVVTALLISEIIFRLGDYLSAGLMGDIFPTQHQPFLLGTGIIAFIVTGLALRYFHVSTEWRRSIELESQARIRALQARIRPHFLFNSMNTIAELTRSDPAKAEAAVEDLADLFRASLSEARNWVTLEEELDIARIYQRIEQLRLGQRLQVEWQVTDLPMQTPMPSLMIQPLLENAVYHGIEPLPQGGTIVIAGRKFAEQLELSVSNPVPTQASERRSGNGIALDNIRQRLELAWPGRAQVLQSQTEGLYQITLRFPCPAPPVFKEP
jgi:two-component system, LytTR family, sensor histidine kinase AlgZ